MSLLALYEHLVNVQKKQLRTPMDSERGRYQEIEAKAFVTSLLFLGVGSTSDKCQVLEVAAKTEMEARC